MKFNTLLKNLLSDPEILQGFIEAEKETPILNSAMRESLIEKAYSKDELMDKFGTDNLDIINAGNEEDVTLSSDV